jgi:hypothetical protein
VRAAAANLQVMVKLVANLLNIKITLFGNSLYAEIIPHYHFAFFSFI